MSCRTAGLLHILLTFFEVPVELTAVDIPAAVLIYICKEVFELNLSKDAILGLILKHIHERVED